MNTVYLVYKITNINNSKTYIGCHKTRNIWDSYMGSGKLIKRAITKYGKENFCKEILYVANSEIEMFSKEAELIAIHKPEYNLHEGGLGGWTYTNNHYSPTARILAARKAGKASADRLLVDSEYRALHLTRFEKMKHECLATGKYKNRKPFAGKSHSDNTKQLMSKAAKKRIPNMLGKRHSEETKEKIRQSMLNRRVVHR